MKCFLPVAVRVSKARVLKRPKRTSAYPFIVQENRKKNQTLVHKLMVPNIATLMEVAIEATKNSVQETTDRITKKP